MKKNMEVNTTSFSSINSTTKIVGEIFSDSDIRIDGNVEGNVNCKAKIILGQTASVKGDLFCQNADISCNIAGNINVENLLTLSASANVKGDIYTQKLVIESGAIFIGKCEMGTNLPAKKQSPETKAPELSPLFKDEKK